jgi:hypothetical protein
MAGIDSSLREQIREIAQNAIESINRITNVIENPPSSVPPIQGNY